MEANHILKFRKIDNFMVSSLERSQIYFARPDELNDPFDCQVDIEKSLRKAIFQSSGSKRKTLENILNNDAVRKLFNQAQQEIQSYSVFSGSHKPALESSLMWSHYADKHKGVCLIYAIPTEPKIFYKKNQIICTQNIIYGSNQLTEWFKKLPDSKNIYNFAFEEMIKLFLNIKHISWKYEDEVRMIRKTSGIVSIDKSYLQHVCFGLKVPEGNMRNIREILTKLNYDVGYSMMYNGDSDFALRVMDID